LLATLSMNQSEMQFELRVAQQQVSEAIGELADAVIAYRIDHGEERPWPYSDDDPKMARSVAAKKSLVEAESLRETARQNLRYSK